MHDTGQLGRHAIVDKEVDVWSLTIEQASWIDINFQSFTGLVELGVKYLTFLTEPTNLTPQVLHGL